MSIIDIIFRVKDDNAAQKIDNIKKSVNSASSVASAGAKAFSGMFGSILAGNLVSQVVTRSLNAMKDTLVACAEEAMEHQNAVAQLEAVLKSTNNAVGMTTDELVDLSIALQNQTTYTNDAVLGAENLLLTFTNIGRDIFPQATETVLNMSKALNQDLKSSAIQLGKALQDPILGVTALRRVGVNFNEAQTNVIKRMVETGHAADAQKAILKELATEFGGSAQAAAKTFAGRLEQIRNQAKEVQEAIGNILVQNPAFITALEGVSIQIRKIAEAVDKAKPFLTAFMNQFFGSTLAYMKMVAVEERFLQNLKEQGKKQAEDIVAAYAKEGASLNILGVNVVEAAKKFLGLMKATGGSGAAILTLDQIVEKFNLRTKTETVAALKEAEQSMKTLKASTERTPGAVQALQKVIDELRESLYGKKERSIIDDILDARKNPKFMTPIPIRFVVTTDGGDLPVLGDSRKKLIEQAIASMTPPPKLKFDWKGVADDISRFWQDGIADMIAGTSSFRDFVANSFNTLAAGVGSAIGKLAGNALKGLGAIAGPIGSMVGGLVAGAVSAIGKLFGIKSKAEKERERAAKAEAELKKQTDAVIKSYAALGAVSDQTARAIAESTKQIGRARTEAKYLDDIIRDVGVNASNLNALWIKAMATLRNTRNGLIPAQEGIGALNDAFESLLSGTRDLGREYGQNIARFMIELRTSGVRVSSALDYMRDQLSKIPDAFGKIIGYADMSIDRLADVGTIATQSFAAMVGGGMDFIEAAASMKDHLTALKERYAQLGIAADESLERLFGISDVAAANKGLFEAISANKTIIEALGNSGWMTADAMSSLSANAADFYAKLEGAGLSSEDSLRAMGPTLQRLYDYAKAYGLQVDQNTQSLIDQARALGIVKDEADVQAAAMAKVFDGFADRLDGIMTKFGKQISSIFGGGDVFQGASDLPGYASGGIAWTPQIARVAEKKPEAIIPLEDIAKAAAGAGGRGPAAAGGPMVINLMLNGKRLARLIAPDIETLMRQGRFKTDISTMVRNES